MKKILITGACGQLALTLKDKIGVKKYTDKEFIFMSKEELSLANESALKGFFNSCKIEVCINCAAYTNVDQAQCHPDLAYNSNALGAQLLSIYCDLHKILLVHISTDYVFDGKIGRPYIECDIPRPINVYGASKRAGELFVMENAERYFIVRTSWLFSKFGSSFIKAVGEHTQAKKVFNAIKDQYGSPTYTDDLAEFLLFLIENRPSCYGVYHFSNQGGCTRYELAKTFLSITKQTSVFLRPILSEAYPTTAPRPSYSALDTIKVEKTFPLSIPHWREALERFVSSSNP